MISKHPEYKKPLTPKQHYYSEHSK